MVSFWNNFQDRKTAFEQLLETQEAIEKPEQTSWRGLQAGFSQFVSDFIQTSSNISFDFLHKQAAKNCEDHERSSKKYLFDF